MAEYIDREKMLKYLEENNAADEWIVGQYNADWVYSFIESQPTADVVEVVRCKDCKHRRETVHRSYCLPAFGLKQITDLNGYCSYGKRRDT